VPGTASIYQVFGVSGSALNDAANAELIPFSPGANNVFTFSVSGTISNCCTQRGPDGELGASGSVVGVNGLSNVQGNSGLPLLGVFLTDTTPVGGTAPAALPYDANNPTSLAPVIGQIFYIGDGRAGLANASGAVLTFTAPPNATRLYVGMADGFDGQPPTMYGDNSGSFTVHATRP